MDFKIQTDKKIETQHASYDCNWDETSDAYWCGQSMRQSNWGETTGKDHKIKIWKLKYTAFGKMKQPTIDIAVLDTIPEGLKKYLTSIGINQ